MSVYISPGNVLKAPFRYVNWHFQQAGRIAWALTIKTPPRIFTTLMAVRQAVLRTKARISYDAATGTYTASDGERTLAFLERNRATLYDNGIQRRVDTLGKQYLLDLVPMRDNDVVVDCGANIGELYFYLAALPVALRYIAYEPSPGEYLCLQRNVQCGECHNAGLWNENADRSLFISSFGADSSLIEPGRFERRTTIRVVRLDEHMQGPIRLLKLEAEGAEPEVVRGCEKLLPQIDYIAADLGPERGQAEENTVAEVTNYLLARNFELVRMSTGRIVLLFRNRGTT